MKGLLVIVPCGHSKIWNRYPNAGPTPARDVYTGAPFKVNRDYAERFGEKWIILSAKYGFISPDFVIPGPYNVTFKEPSTSPIPFSALVEQVREQELERFQEVIGLGGKEYCAAVQRAFSSTNAKPRFPFAGLPIGLMMKATKRATELGKPY